MEHDRQRLQEHTLQGDDCPDNTPDDRPEQDERSLEKKLSQEIADTGSVTAVSPRGVVHCLTIVGQIEGHMVLPSDTKSTKYEHVLPLLTSVEESDEVDKSTKYEHVIPQLAAIEESPDIEGLLIILNTVGGDVEAGLAIAEMIASMKKPTVSLVLGGGHSIGVPLAVAAKRSFIVPSATMTIHPVRMNGLVIGVPQMMNHFARMQERITAFVERNSKISASRFTELMMNTGELVTDVGTTLSGENAVSESLIDSLGTLNEVIESLYSLIEEK